MTQMNEIFHSLTLALLEKNHTINYDQARTWVEYLWEDFETTRAKAGHDYLGTEATERIVRQWIGYYGSHLHDFINTNPKFKHLMKPDDISQ